jgi:hypothetical protein
MGTGRKWRTLQFAICDVAEFPTTATILLWAKRNTICDLAELPTTATILLWAKRNTICDLTELPTTTTILLWAKRNIYVSKNCNGFRAPLNLYGKLNSDETGQLSFQFPIPA